MSVLNNDTYAAEAGGHTMLSTGFQFTIISFTMVYHLRPHRPAYEDLKDTPILLGLHTDKF